ncbi:MAG: hypothetical protein EBT07_13125 [Actinobacteria bacterium]|nr:hypothetical protein [Actinomycetota bacterium]
MDQIQQSHPPQKKERDNQQTGGEHKGTGDRWIQAEEKTHQEVKDDPLRRGPGYRMKTGLAAKKGISPVGTALDQHHAEEDSSQHEMRDITIECGVAQRISEERTDRKTGVKTQPEGHQMPSQHQ